jgi:hypothetical protein
MGRALRAVIQLICLHMFCRTLVQTVERAECGMCALRAVIQLTRHLGKSRVYRCTLGSLICSGTPPMVGMRVPLESYESQVSGGVQFVSQVSACTLFCRTLMQTAESAEYGTCQLAVCGAIQVSQQHGAALLLDLAQWAKSCARYVFSCVAFYMLAK